MKAKRKSIWLLLPLGTLILAIVIFLMYVQMSKSSTKQANYINEFEENRVIAMDSAEQVFKAMGEQSNFARSFIETLDMKYFDSYMEQLDETSEEDAFQSILLLKLETDEMNEIRNAKQSSDQAVVMQKWAVALTLTSMGFSDEEIPPELKEYAISTLEKNKTSEEQLQIARDYITGSDYEKLLSDARWNLLHFENKLSNRYGDFSVRATNDNAQTMHSILVTISVVLFLLVIMAVIFWIFIERAIKKQEQQNQKIQAALNVAREASQSKSEFISRVSHDMRTPLNVILSMAKLVPEERPTYDTMLSYFQTITDEGSFLLRLINDVLDMQKMESGIMTLSPEKVEYKAEILTSVVRQAKLLADEKHVTFTFEEKNLMEGGLAYVDPLRLQQIYMNLLSNAIKYAPENGRVELILENLSYENNVAKDKIIIRDNGLGMSDSFMERMYEPFSQEHGGSTSTTRGTGLGLSIVKKIVDLMGGIITCKSELGKGTEFTLLLDTPLFFDNEKVKETVPYVMHNDLALVGRRILLCEDHPMNAMIAEKLLKRKGLIVTHAENGQVGLDDFINSKEGYYDAILMDVRMPVMDGLEATKAIRALSRKDAGSIPIIAMTANAYNEDVEQCIAAGMNAHLAKPVDPEKIWQALFTYIDFN